MIRRRKGRKFLKKDFSLTSFIPNMMTLLALVCGMTSMRFAMLERWDFALFSILFAAFLDGMDGRVARFLGGDSRFGAQLDSFADFVNFGVAPAIILYLKCLHKWGEIGWGLCVFFSVCMVLRLARFNISEGNSTYFTGVPAPAGAYLVLSPIIFSYAFPTLSLISSPFFYGGVTLLSSLLVVSNFPTISLKKLKIHHTFILPLMITFLIVLISLYSFPWITLSFFSLTYTVSLPVYFYSKKNLPPSST